MTLIWDPSTECHASLSDWTESLSSEVTLGWWSSMKSIGGSSINRNNTVQELHCHS